MLISAANLINLLEAGDVDLILWGEVDPVKLVGVGKTGFVLVKLWVDGRETIELIPLVDVQEVRVRE